MASNRQNNLTPINGAKLTVKTEHRSAFIGPLPRPEDLEMYANLIPDGANRIMKMAENQADHRMFLEKSVLASNIKRSNTGLWLGFFVVIAIVVGSFYIAATRTVIEGIIGAVSTLVLGIIYYYIVYKTRQLELKNQSDNKLPQENKR
jgi:uncharacterized membrane protein